jgi:hypothetical protein
MKLDSYAIKSAMMDARWDEAAELPDRHFVLPGVAVDLLEKNPRFKASASHPGRKFDYAISVYAKDVLFAGSYYYGWHQAFGFEDWKSTMRDFQIIFHAPREVYVKVGMMV